MLSPLPSAFVSLAAATLTVAQAGAPHQQPVSYATLLGRPRYDAGELALRVPFAGAVPQWTKGTLRQPPRIFLDFDAPTRLVGVVSEGVPNHPVWLSWAMAPRDRVKTRLTLVFRRDTTVAVRVDRERGVLLVIPRIPPPETGLRAVPGPTPTDESLPTIPEPTPTPVPIARRSLPPSPTPTEPPARLAPTPRPTATSWSVVTTPAPTMTPWIPVRPTPAPTMTPWIPVRPTPAPTMTPWIPVRPTPAPTMTPWIPVRPTPAPTMTPWIPVRPTPAPTMTPWIPVRPSPTPVGTPAPLPSDVYLPGSPEPRETPTITISAPTPAPAGTPVRVEATAPPVRTTPHPQPGRGPDVGAATSAAYGYYEEVPVGATMAARADNQRILGARLATRLWPGGRDRASTDGWLPWWGLGADLFGANVMINDVASAGTLHARQEWRTHLALTRGVRLSPLELQGGVGLMGRYETSWTAGSAAAPGQVTSGWRAIVAPELLATGRVPLFGPVELYGEGAVAPFALAWVPATSPALPSLTGNRFEAGLAGTWNGLRLAAGYRRWSLAGAGYGETFQGPVVTLGGWLEP